MSTQKDSVSKGTICKLNNQLDLWHHETSAWLNNPKKKIIKVSIRKFGREILSYLTQNEVVTKEDWKIVLSQECAISLVKRRSQGQLSTDLAPNDSKNLDNEEKLYQGVIETLEAKIKSIKSELRECKAEKEDLIKRYQDVIETLKAKIKTVKSELRECQAEKDDLIKRSCDSGWKDRALRYKAQRNESKLEIRQQNRELNKICERGESVNQLVDLRSQNDLLKEKLAILSSEKAHLEDGLKIKDKELQDLTDERIIDAKEIAYYQEESSRDRVALKKQQQLNGKLLDQNKSLKCDIVENEKQLEKKYEELNFMTLQLYTIDKKLQEETERNKQMHIENYHLKQSNTSHLRPIAIENRRLLDFEKIEKDNISLKKELNVALETLEKLKEQNTHLEEKCKQEKEKRANKDGFINNNLIEENDMFKREINSAKNEPCTIRKDNDELLQELKKEFTALKSANAKLKKENEYLKEKSNTDQEKINMLQVDWKNFVARYNKETETRLHNDDNVNKLSEDNNRLRSERNSLRNELKLLKEKEKKVEELTELEVTATQSENEKQKQEKDNLITFFKEESNRDKEAIRKLRQEREELLVKDLKLKVSKCPQCDAQEIAMAKLQKEKQELKDKSRSTQGTSEPKQCQNCCKYKNDISELKKEVNSLRDRLSEAAGKKMRDNNPNIADLSDMNRPTSLAEKFSTLYTDEYSDAMEVIENNMSEEECAGTMLQWLKSCYEWCERLATEQRDLLTERSIGFMQDHLGRGEKFVISARCLIHVKEFQKKIAVDTLIAVAKICHIKSLKEKNLLNDDQVTKYIKKCSELCWMMQISDPPLCLKFDVKRGESLDRNSYNVFTKSGSKVDFLVWPVLYLHKIGPLLAKGVAQGM